MLCIAASSKHIAIIKKAAGSKTDELFSFTVTEGFSEPVVCSMNNGKLSEWFRGMKPLLNFIKYGYVFFERTCPYHIFGRCRGPKCQLFIIENYVGDCSIRWSAITSFAEKKRQESN